MYTHRAFLSAPSHEHENLWLLSCRCARFLLNPAITPVNKYLLEYTYSFCELLRTCRFGKHFLNYILFGAELLILVLIVKRPDEFKLEELESRTFILQ